MLQAVWRAFAVTITISVTFTVTIIVVAVRGAAIVQVSLDIAFGRFTIVTAAGRVAATRRFTVPAANGGTVFLILKARGHALGRASSAVQPPPLTTERRGWSRANPRRKEGQPPPITGCRILGSHDHVDEGCSIRIVHHANGKPLENLTSEFLALA
jgi:hypothetical protein